MGQTMSKNSNQQKLLIWFPVVLMSLFNLLSALMTGSQFTASVPMIIGAVAEELFYRFFLLKTLLLREERILPSISIVLISILFAAAHLFNLLSGAAAQEIMIQVISAFSFGMWAGAMVWKTNSIWIPVTAHILVNLTASGNCSIIMQIVVSVIVLLDAVWMMNTKRSK